ncbi:MAG: hypothetical protein ACXVLQ_09805 [Bacteriovorax sp.]
MPAQKPSKTPNPNLNKTGQGQKPSGSTPSQTGSKGSEERKSGSNISSGKK